MKSKIADLKMNSRTSFIIISLLTLFVLGFTYAFCNIEAVKKVVSGEKNLFKAEIASGTAGEVNWIIKDDGELVLSGDGTLPNYNNTGDTPWYNYRTRITGVNVFSGVKTNTNAVSLFAGLENCTWISMKNLDTVTNKTISLSHFFDGCKKMTSLSLPDSFVTANVVSISHMFFDCQSMTTIDVSKFDTINVTNIQNMFMCCYKLQTINWGTFNTNKVTNFSNLFHSDYSLTSVKAFSTPKATNMVNMFYGCSSLTSIDLSGFYTSAVTSMKQMFQNCGSLTSLDLSNFNMSAVIDVSNMLSGLGGCNSINFGANFRFKAGSTNVNMYSYYWRKDGTDGTGETDGTDGTSTIWSSVYLRDHYTSEYAGQWIRTYLIRYYQAGSDIGQSYVDCGQTGNLTRYSSLSATAPANWTFIGWSTSSTGVTQNYNDVHQITDAPVTDVVLNLYAIFSRELVIQYDGNGNTGGSTSNTSKTVIYNPGNGNVTGSQTLSLKSNGYTKDGFSFAGWNTQSDGNGTTYIADSNYTPSIPANDSTFTVTLYAKWSSNTLQYTVNHYVHDLDNNTYTKTKTDTAMGEKGSSITLSSLSTSIPGFTYEEGFKDSGGTTKPTSGAVTDITIPNATNMTINLYYRRNYLYLQYNMNKGTLAAEHNSSIGMNGDVVTGSNNDAILRGVYGSRVGSVNLSTYAINNDGLHDYSNPSAINIKRSGYKAVDEAQWCLLDSNGDIIKTYNQLDTSYLSNDIAHEAGYDLSQGDVTVPLYVNWQPEEYTVTYNANGGIVDTESFNVTYDNEYGQLEYPTKEGYDFMGWSLIPTDYEPLEYIEGNGNQYINSGYKPSTRTGIDVKYQFLSLDLQQRIYGEQGLNDHAGTMNYELYINSNGKLAYAYKDGSGNWIETPFVPDLNIHRVRFNLEGDYIKYDENDGERINCQATISSPYNMYIMGTNKDVYTSGQWGDGAKIRIYEFSIYEAGVLQKKFIPCRRKTDGKLGMYELISNSFCPSLGSNGIIGGPKAYIDAASNVSYPADHPLYAEWGIRKYVVQYYQGNNDAENEGATVLGSEIYNYGESNNLKTFSELGGQSIQGWEFVGWNDNVGYGYTEPKYIDGQSVINLKEGSGETFVDADLSEGKYINYYNTDGQKTLCRVLYDANSVYGRNGIQIISVDNINNVELTGETTCNIAFLNDYENEKLRTDLVQSVRTVGSIPNDKYSCDELSETYGGQKNYLIDLEKMNQLGITNVGHDYWLGSESYVDSNYEVYYLDSNGTIQQETLFVYNEEEPVVDPGDDPIVDPGDDPIVDPGDDPIIDPGNEPGGDDPGDGPGASHTGDDYIEEPNTPAGTVSTAIHGYRPVYTLRQDIRVMSGDGTADNPYNVCAYYDDEIIRLYAIYQRNIKFHSSINNEETTEIQYYNPYSTDYTSEVEAPLPSLTDLEEYNWKGLGYRPDKLADAEVYTVAEGVYVDDTGDTDYTDDTSMYDTNDTTNPYTDEDDITADPNNTGYTNDDDTFEETYEDITSISPAYNDYDSEDPTSTVLNLYAIYSRDLTMSYNGNGATGGGMESQKSDVPQYLNSSGNISGYIFTTGENEFIRPGYTFRCWANDSADGLEINEGEDALEFIPAMDSDNTNKEIYALWDIITYEIVYDLGEGELTTPNPTSYNVETETFTLNKPTKIGYTFIGWTGTNGDTPEKNLTIERGSTGDREYIANWAENVVVVNINKDNVAWSDTGMYVALFQNGEEKYSTTIESGTQVTFNLVYEGTYDVYAGKSYLNKNDLVDTGIDVVVGDAANP